MGVCAYSVENAEATAAAAGRFKATGMDGHTGRQW